MPSDTCKPDLSPPKEALTQPLPGTSPSSTARCRSASRPTRFSIAESFNKHSGVWVAPEGSDLWLSPAGNPQLSGSNASHHGTCPYGLRSFFGHLMHLQQLRLISPSSTKSSRCAQSLKVQRVELNHCHPSFQDRLGPPQLCSWECRGACLVFNLLVLSTRPGHLDVTSETSLNHDLPQSCDRHLFKELVGSPSASFWKPTGSTGHLLPVVTALAVTTCSLSYS